MGISFFVSQIIVDSNFFNLYKQLFQTILDYQDKNIDIFISIMFVKNYKTLNILQSLGVISNSDFDKKIKCDDYNYKTHFKNILEIIIKNHLKLSFEVFSHSKKYRIKDINIFKKL